MWNGNFILVDLGTNSYKQGSEKLASNLQNVHTIYLNINYVKLQFLLKRTRNLNIYHEIHKRMSNRYLVQNGTCITVFWWKELGCKYNKHSFW